MDHSDHGINGKQHYGYAAEGDFFDRDRGVWGMWKYTAHCGGSCVEGFFAGTYSWDYLHSACLCDERADWIRGCMGTAGNRLLHQRFGVVWGDVAGDDRAESCCTVPICYPAKKCPIRDAICPVFIGGGSLYKRDRCMNFLKGSYTIEAAFTIPLLLFTFAFAMRTAVLFYQESKEDVAGYYKDDAWIVEVFYRDEFVGGWIDGTGSDTF